MVTAHKSSVMLLSLFLQVVEVVRYLLFSDRKKYPIKRGGMCALRYHKEKCTIWVVPEKNPHTPDGWDSGNSGGREVKDPGNPGRRWGGRLN